MDIRRLYLHGSKRRHPVISKLLAQHRASSTLAGYRRAIRDFNTSKLPLRSLEKWLTKRTDHKSSTRAKEIGNLSHMLERTEPETHAQLAPLLRDLAQSAARMAAVEMKDKAVPLTPPDANAMIDLVAPTARARALYWMMWHAASRYDDIKDLTFENFRTATRR
jgi:hypothetical protein